MGFKLLRRVLYVLLSLLICSSVDAQETKQIRCDHPGELVALSNFVRTIDGWTISGDATNLRNEISGTPFIAADDKGKGIWWYFNAPSKFLGDKRSSYGYSIFFDLNQIKDGTPFFSDDILKISDGETTLVYNPDPDPVSNGWTSFRICFHESHPWDS